MLLNAYPEQLVKWLGEEILAVRVEVQHMQEMYGREVMKPEERATTNMDTVRMSATSIEDALQKFEAAYVDVKKTTASDVKKLAA